MVSIATMLWCGKSSCAPPAADIGNPIVANRKDYTHTSETNDASDNLRASGINSTMISLGTIRYDSCPGAQPPLLKSP